MINIISQSFASKKTRGPKKVVSNLVKGLEKLNYPFVINKQLDATKLLWIHDDIFALKKIKDLPPEIKVIVGPNLFVNPENIPANLDLSRTVYIQPAENVKKVWEARGYNKSPLDVWSVGIDTDVYAPTLDKKEYVLVYFKNREAQELAQVTNHLEKDKIKYTTLTYGTYKEEDYIEILKRTRYIIWLGGSESQGIAFEEALSANVPILVLDKVTDQASFDKDSTSAPYFSEECGIRIVGLDHLHEAIFKMENRHITFHPRQFIVRNLGLTNQARNFLALYEKHFGVSYEEGRKEKLQPGKNHDWHGENIFQKIVRKLFQK